jgi:PAS domain S-box-containing protein
MAKPLNTLIVEDSEDDCLLVLRELRRGGYDPVHERIETPDAMRSALANRKWDIVVSDYILPKFSGLAALALIKESGLDLPFIIVSGNIGEDTAVGAMRAGANDYILKGNLKRLVPAVERELREAVVRRDRKRIEDERNRLSAAVESAAEAVVITEPSSGMIQYVNRAFEQITGYTREEVLGHNLHMLDSGKQGDQFYQELREAIERDGVWRGQMVSKKKDGTEYFEDCAISPVKGPSGETLNYLSLKRDITEKLRLESIAESVNTMNSIGYIFSGVRHEIGNPINSINMILGILSSKLPHLSQEAIRDYLDRITGQISRVEFLLRSLKSFNMYESQEPQPLRMVSFMELFLPLVRDDLEKKGIALELKLDPRADRVYADPRALQQVLVNLITNAVDALCERDHPMIALSVSPSDGFVHIKVEDNGCGMAEDKVMDLFKPFYTTKANGTGLGLVIVKKMITRMNGTIAIESRRDMGTIVTISLPEGSHEGR